MEDICNEFEIKDLRQKLQQNVFVEIFKGLNDWFENEYKNPKNITILKDFYTKLNSFTNHNNFQKVNFNNFLENLQKITKINTNFVKIHVNSSDDTMKKNAAYALRLEQLRYMIRWLRAKHPIQNNNAIPRLEDLVMYRNLIICALTKSAVIETNPNTLHETLNKLFGPQRKILYIVYFPNGDENRPNNVKKIDITNTDTFFKPSFLNKMGDLFVLQNQIDSNIFVLGKTRGAATQDNRIYQEFNEHIFQVIKQSIYEDKITPKNLNLGEKSKLTTIIDKIKTFDEIKFIECKEASRKIPTKPK